MCFSFLSCSCRAGETQPFPYQGTPVLFLLEIGCYVCAYEKAQKSIKIDMQMDTFVRFM